MRLIRSLFLIIIGLMILIAINTPGASANVSVDASTSAATAAPTDVVTPEPVAQTAYFTVFPKKVGWQATTVHLKAGDIYILKSGGAVNIWPNCEQTKAQQGYPNLDCSLATMGPNGTIAFPLAPASYPYPGGLVGALVARIGSEKPFLVGVGGTFTAQSDGILQFAFNDIVKMQDNQGVFTVAVTIPQTRLLTMPQPTWLDLNLSVSVNDVLILTATGTINLLPDCTEPNPQNIKCADTLISPAGTTTLAPDGYPMPGAPIGALIARIGDGPLLLIGDGITTIAVSGGGPLQIEINDLPQNIQKATGEFKIVVTSFRGVNAVFVSGPTWANTVALTKDQTVTITASGNVSCDKPSQIDCGPLGSKTAQLAPDNFPLPKARIGALIGRIGDSKPFLVGSGGTFKADRDGTLQLGINAVSAISGGFVVIVNTPILTNVPPQAKELIAPPETTGKVVNVPFPVNITLDGQLDDWVGVPFEHVDRGPKLSKDPAEDGSFDFAVAADKSQLYVLMLMTDRNIVTGQHGTDYWNEDSMEFYLNLSDNLAAKSYNDKVYQITINPGDLSKNDVDLLNVTGVNSQNIHVQGIVFKTATGWGFEAAVPLLKAPQDGAMIGFQASANGATKRDRDVKLIWSLADKADTSYRNPSVFGRGDFFELGSK